MRTKALSPVTPLPAPPVHEFWEIWEPHAEMWVKLPQETCDELSAANRVWKGKWLHQHLEINMRTLKVSGDLITSVRRLSQEIETEIFLLEKAVRDQNFGLVRSCLHRAKSIQNHSVLVSAMGRAARCLGGTLNHDALKRRLDYALASHNPEEEVVLALQMLAGQEELEPDAEPDEVNDLAIQCAIKSIGLDDDICL
eukprot:GEMP01055478.1.p1 GENE.GEMP01055478.1~~GEMP01055478.1.p1  ORF type:complete len:197 (+),score=44.13 GEMP01055478.1:277-867(+)